MVKRFVGRMVWVATIMMVVSKGAWAQGYPTRPIHLVTSEAGSGNDFVARLLAPGLTETLGQPFIIDNKSANVASEYVYHEPADGYTLLHGGPAFWLVPFLRENPPFDPLRDFVAIAMTHRTPNILVVNPSVPAKSVKDLIALAKSKPGALNVATAGYGGQPHIGAEMFKLMTASNVTLIPYKGGASAVNSLVSGDVQMMFATADTSSPQIKSGRLKALAITTLQPSPLFPDLPTVAETIPGFDLTTTIGIFTRANTPPAIIPRLNQEVVRILAQPDVKDKLFKVGVEPVGYSPEQAAAYVKSDYESKGKVIQAAGIKAN